MPKIYIWSDDTTFAVRLILGAVARQLLHPHKMFHYIQAN